MPPFLCNVPSIEHTDAFVDVFALLKLMKGEVREDTSYIEPHGLYLSPIVVGPQSIKKSIRVVVIGITDRSKLIPDNMIVSVDGILAFDKSNRQLSIHVNLEDITEYRTSIRGTGDLGVLRCSWLGLIVGRSMDDDDSAACWDVELLGGKGQLVQAILEGTEEDVSGRLEDFPEDNFCTFTALFDGLGTTPQFKVLRMSGAIPLRPVKPPPKRKAAPKGKQTVTGAVAEPSGTKRGRPAETSARKKTKVDHDDDSASQDLRKSLTGTKGGGMRIPLNVQRSTKGTQEAVAGPSRKPVRTRSRLSRHSDREAVSEPEAADH